MAAKAVLGISLGTRRCGIAVVKGGKLIHCRMLTFPGTWSHLKLKGIVQELTNQLKLHSSEEVAIKIPDVLPTSKAYLQLIGTLNRMSKGLQIPVRYHTLRELKLAHAGTEKVSRSAIIEGIIKRHPQLLPEYQKEQRSMEPYYCKMFEAVLCAHMRC